MEERELKEVGMELKGKTESDGPSSTGGRIIPESPNYLTSVFVAVPAMDKKAFIITCQTLMNAMQVMMINNIRFDFKFRVGLPYVSMARNDLEAMFMKSDCEQMVFLDADVGISPQDFLALVMAPEDVVSAAYPKKSEDEVYAVELEVGPGNHPIEKDGAFKALGAPTGVMKIRRHVFEKMREHYEEKLGYNDWVDGTPRYNFFGTFIDNRRWYGDDYGFCKLWRDIGGEVLILPNMTLIHVGTKNYEGNLYEFLVRQSQSPVVNALGVDGWMSMEELEWLNNSARYMDAVVEIGSFKGRATTALLEGCKGHVYAVDHWLGDDDGNKVLRGIYENEDVFGIFMKNVGCYPNLITKKMSSLEAVNEIPDVDMVFIDGEHTYESVKVDIQAWLPKTRKILCGHDYSKEWPGVVSAVNELMGPVNVVGSIWWKDLTQTPINLGVK